MGMVAAIKSVVISLAEMAVRIISRLGMETVTAVHMK